MALQIHPTTSVERKLLFLETLLNTTDKVSKVSPNSVLSGVAGGVSKISGKAEKDIILAISQLFPDTAFGAQLDQVALNFGISPRFGTSSSSTYVRLVGALGTIYDKTIHTLQASNGIQFEFEDNIVIGSEGYVYAKVRSLIEGLQANVEPLSITKITPTPVGHQYVVNEVGASGGRDVESDELFRIRIKDGANILARGTLAMLEQKFMSVNDKVLRVFYQGITGYGKVRLAIATQNGIDLTVTELDDLLLQSAEYFALTEHRPFGTNFYGAELVNIQYQPIDISFRVDLDPAYDSDEIRKQIQIGISKYMDFRFFDASRDRIEWDNLLEIVKNTQGVKYVPDQYFYPRIDIGINTHMLPRLRGFLMLDLQGVIIQNFTGSLAPIYYPNNPDFSYQQTVLNNI